ncbi:hypothetical protein GCM10023148_42320 [Actinokineospora soli]
MVVAGTASDAHTWNLVFLELYCGERGHDVVNLGPCVPPELLVDECLRVRPRLVVISTVNGHGLVDGQRAVEALRARPELADTPIVIGGKLTTGAAADTAALLDAGATAVFADGDLTGFDRFLADAEQVAS